MTSSTNRPRAKGGEKPVIERINELAREEHDLWKRSDRGITPEDKERLKDLEVTLDQCWDLLHQRRALREAGRDPADSHVRDPEIIEGYASATAEEPIAE